MENHFQILQSKVNFCDLEMCLPKKINWIRKINFHLNFSKQFQEIIVCYTNRLPMVTEVGNELIK